MATALVKIHAFSGYWQSIQGEMGNVLREGKSFTDTSAPFSEVESRDATSTAFEGFERTHLSHPTDSHPPLSIRLQNLGATLSRVQTNALLVNPEQPAVGVVAEYDRIEEHLTTIEHYLLARALGIGASNNAAKKEEQGD